MQGEEKLYNYYAISNLYVSPTLDTGSLTSIIESMACSLPVVSTGQEFWVKPNINGHLVPTKDPMAMAQAVINIYNNKKNQEFGKISRQIAEEYSFKNIAKKALKVYKEFV